MVVVETSVFTRQLRGVLSEEKYRLLQAYLVQHPDAGSLIRGSGGLRKVRWSVGSHGKRGGIRVIYYWAKSQDRILMLLMYPKAKQADLSREQLAILRKIVEEYP